MKRLAASVLAIISTCFGSYAPANAQTMTFDSLPADFSAISSHTENGFTLFALDGGGEHFHTSLNPDNVTTGAQIFESDGVPHRLIRVGGGPFDLVSLDIWSISADATFTNPANQSISVNTTGSVNFGPQFQGVTFVDINIPTLGFDDNVGIDNILAAAVPEPSAFLLLVLGLFGSPRIRR
jgi:hypothetical protein